MADIRDLALHLNISTGTVSRALNNRPGVNAETRARVLEAALALGYVANQSGRALRRGSTNTIGFLIETGSAANQESGDFFFILLDALHLYLAGKGFDLMILPCHSADNPAEFLGRLVARGLVDAVVITATRRHDRRIEMLTRSTLPFLTLGRSETPGAYPWIDLDFDGAARRSVAELAALGHRRIALALPDSDAMLGYHYRRGFESAMAEQGLPVEEALIFRNQTSEAGGFALGRQLAEARPTAVMLCSEATTVGLYAGLQREGLTPGPDLSIVTFRENPQLRFLSPAPSTFRVDVSAIGRMIGERLLALLNPDTRAEAAKAQIIVPLDYLPGASICPPRLKRIFWLHTFAKSGRIAPKDQAAGDTMSEPKEPTAMPAVMQVERRDYPEIAPEGAKRAQPMQGFDACYADIVDYIIRCTHKIWDERDIGLIYTHYTHNCVLYGTTGTLYTREEVVRDTIQRLVSFPERRGMGTHVIWKGDDQAGFYTSHLVTGTGRHSQNGHLGAATGRMFSSRTVADCMIFQNKIYREWVVADTTAILQQLGVDVQGYAERIAKAAFDKGMVSLDIGENRHMIGQYPPEAEADLSLAATDLERHTLRWMHDVFNRKMLGQIAQVYAPTAQYHGPLMAELYGHAAIIHQTLGLIGSIPDAAFTVHHICSTPCEEGGEKVAVRWIMEGHHIGYGILNHLGAPTGKRVQIMGITHFHYKNGKIVDEWRIYDEASALVQVKLAQMADVKAASL